MKKGTSFSGVRCCQSGGVLAPGTGRGRPHTLLLLGRDEGEGGRTHCCCSRDGTRASLITFLLPGRTRAAAHSRSEDEVSVLIEWDSTPRGLVPTCSPRTFPLSSRDEGDGRDHDSEVCAPFFM